MSPKFFTRVLVVVCCVALAAAGSAVAQGPVAKADVGASSIAWQPTGNFSLQLTVSGPGNFYMQKTFGVGEAASFSLFEKSGQVVPAGSYTYELRAIPHLDQATRDNLEAARAAGKDGSAVLSKAGVIPGQDRAQSGSFAVRDGAILMGGVEEPGASKPAGGNQLSTKDVVYNDDLIVEGSACIGFDCVNNESFGFDTLRLKENNLRIKFQDTSSSSGFPSNDWQLTANDSSSGGQNYFSIDDIDGGKTPFKIRAGAPTNSLYVDSGGRIGVGTSTPVVELHVVDGDSPTLRLEQNGSSGFTPQTWDVAGNETNFFVRDVTNGSKLPFKIIPGAPTNSLYINSSGNVGIGDSTPDDKLDVENGVLRVEASNSSGDPRFYAVSNQDQTGTSGQPGFKFENTNSGQTWDFRIGGAGNLILNSNGSTVEFTFGTNGDFTATGAKNFTVMDPDDSGKQIYYAALEGPEAGTYYRGTAELVDGQAKIQLPDFFSKVTETDGLTVQLTPVGGWGQLYVDKLTPQQLVVRVAHGGKDLKFHYLVQGIRAGYKDYKVERTGGNAMQ